MFTYDNTKTQTENQEIFLLDALEYYSVDPENRRCYVEGRCKYHPATVGKEGKSEGCMVGRVMNPETALFLDEKASMGVEKAKETCEIEGIKENVFLLNIDFLAGGQSLHDLQDNWTSKGLSEIGKNFLLILIANYNLNEELFTKYLN